MHSTPNPAPSDRCRVPVAAKSSAPITGRVSRRPDVVSFLTKVAVLGLLHPEEVRRRDLFLADVQDVRGFTSRPPRF